MARATAIITSALLKEVGEMLTEDSLSSPRLGGQWRRFRTVMHLGPPDLDQGYYFLGLLDCAAQLATLGNPGMFRVQFVDKIMCLIFESTVPEYRWKAMEILLSCRETRRAQLHDLRTRVERTTTQSSKETLLEEVSAVRDLLDDDEKVGLRLNVSQLPPDEFIEVSQLPPDDFIERLEQSNVIPIAPTVSSNLSPSIPPVQTDWNEPELPRSRVRSTRCFSLSLHRAKTLGGGASYDFAGISNDCEYAYVYRDDAVSVFSLANIGAQCTEPAFQRILDLGRDFTNGEPIFGVVMSKSFLVVITCQHVRVINVCDNYGLEASPHGDWEPSGVACFENETRLVIALGQGQGNSLNSSKGRIMLFKYEPGTGPKKLSSCSTIKLPTGNRPKQVSLDADGRTLTCVTTIQSKILVWSLDEDLSASRDPYEFVKNHYCVERYETGVTHTCLYTSPTQKRYILATTSPSSERHRNDGEWSFSLPLPLPVASEASVATRLRPPSQTIHNFEQFRKHRGLRTGTVSQCLCCDGGHGESLDAAADGC